MANEDEEVSCGSSVSFKNLEACLKESLDELKDDVLSRIGNAVRDTVTGETDKALEGLAEVINEQVANTLDTLMSWIVADSNLDLLSGSANATITRMDSYLSPLVLAIAVIAVLVAATKMILTRKANPLLPVGQGIFVVIVVQAIGLPLADLLIRLFDIWSEWVITDAREQGVDARLIEVMTFGQYSGGGEPDPDTNLAAMWAGVILVIIFGIVVLFIAAIQIILMIFREAVIIILAAMLPLAAVGMLMQSTASWLQKVVSWMLSLILYKPTVATIYAITFIFIAEGENDLNTYLAGMMMLLISLFALKALLSLFSWATGSAGGGGGMGGAAMGGMAGAMAGSGSGAASGGGGGSAPSNQAADTNQRLGNAESGGGSGSGSGGGGATNAPTGAKPETGGQPTSNVPGSGGQDKGGGGGEGAPEGAKPSSQTSATSDAGVTGGAAAAGGPAGAALAAGAKAVETGVKTAEGAVSDVTTPPDQKGS